MFGQITSTISRLYDTYMPAFWLRLKPRYQWAGGIAILVTLWVATGVFNSHAQTTQGAGLSTKPDDVARVRVSELVATSRDATITVRGRTQAMHEVDVRAEVEGVVQAIHFDKGDKVKAGDVLCEIKLNDRGAKAAQAAALIAQTLKELQVARDLYAEGFRSKTQLAQSEAAYAQAQAGAFNDGNPARQHAHPGAVRRLCRRPLCQRRRLHACRATNATLVIAPEPFLAVGTVAEHEVGEIRVGDKASATLVTGETVPAKFTFVADRADPTTRTFRVEVQLPNPDAKLRDGVSADIHIPVRQLKPRSTSRPAFWCWTIPVRSACASVIDGMVRFIPMQIISDGPDGMWVSGLPDRVNVITVGQEFVTNGERVKAVPEKAE